MNRIQQTYIFDSKMNAGKMVLLFGPRQVGKTTLARAYLKSQGVDELYYNWDDPYVGQAYLDNPHFLSAPLARTGQPCPPVVLDEIHKHRNWKNILKGLYDTYKERARLIVTGSARLDFFRESGDSLVGRYFSYRLLPLGAAETAGVFDHLLNDPSLLRRAFREDFVRRLYAVEQPRFSGAFQELMEWGGFPEPFVKKDKRFSTKWRRDYHSRLIHEDLRDLTRIQDIRGVEQMSLLLPGRVGSPLSLNSLARDLRVQHKTVSGWIEAFKKIYLIFAIPPWSRRITRAIRKETKIYYFDWALLKDEGARFENLVAVMLWRLASRWNELGLGEFEIRYVRDRQGRETDFLLVADQEPLCLFEAKLAPQKTDKSAAHFSRELGVPCLQVTAAGEEVVIREPDQMTVPSWRLFALTG